MISENGRNNHQTDQAHSLPQYVCIDEDEAVVVMDYLNGAEDRVDKELVLGHLALCFDCQEAAAAMMGIDTRVRERVLALNVPALVG
jgi:hypothetical protein